MPRCSPGRLPAALVFAVLLLPRLAHTQGQPTTQVGAGTVETQRRFAALAPKLVQSARIRPGDLVTINGGPAMIPEMEALGAEVLKAGGRPVLLLDSPRLLRTAFTDVPEKYLEQPSTALEEFQAQRVAVAFILPLGEDFASIARSADPRRRARVQQAFAKADGAAAAERSRGTTRRLVMRVPAPSDTASIQMDYREYEAMTWTAIEADYQAMAAKGSAIKKALEGAKRVHITSPEGTDFTVELGGRPVVVSAGIVPPGTQGTMAARTAALPGGSVRFAPLETSANGKLRAAEDQCDQPVRDEAVDVRNGLPTNVRAASDEECLRRSFDEAGRFGSITIGLNPAIRFTHVPSYSSQLDNAAGVVSVNFSGNQELGGNNPPARGGWTVPLLRATVEADGKVLVRDGKLAL
jgi:aminopeptidase